MITFYVIRAKKDSPKFKSNPQGTWEFKRGWYAAREYVKPFEHVKIFTTKGKASTYLRSSSTLGRFLNREEYFEIVPLEIKEPGPSYDNNDFVTFCEGMGEMGYGTIIGRSGNNYKVQMWTHNAEIYPSYVREVPPSDMRDFCTPEDAMEYFLIRSGKK